MKENIRGDNSKLRQLVVISPSTSNNIESPQSDLRRVKNNYMGGSSYDRTSSRANILEQSMCEYIGFYIFHL